MLCDSHDAEKEILGQIRQGCTSPGVHRKALKDNLRLKQVLDEVRSLELSESRAAVIENAAAAANTVSNDATTFAVNRGHRGLGGHRGHR